jgi:hypothetical protein
MTMKRWSGIAGIVFVALAIASAAAQGSKPNTLERGAVQKFVTFYADKSHNSHALLSAVLGVLGLFFFAWFLGGLWSTLRDAEGATTAATIVIAVGGAAFFSLAGTAHLVGNVIGISRHFDKDYTVADPKLALVLNDLATGAIIAAMIGIGAALSAAGVIIRRTRVLPIWLAWFAFVITLITLPAIPPLSFLAAALFAIWTLVVSVIFLTRPEAAAA